MSTPIEGTAFLMARHGAADQIAGVQRLAPAFVAQALLGVWEAARCREFRASRRARPPGRLDRCVRRSTPGIEGIGVPAILAVDDEERPDQVVGRQSILADKPACPLRLAVAPGSVRQVEPVRTGSQGLLSWCAQKRGDSRRHRGLLHKMPRQACQGPPPSTAATPTPNIVVPAFESVSEMAMGGNAPGWRTR